MSISKSIAKSLIMTYHSQVYNGQVDQLEDRYLGMVEAASSNLALSTFFYSVFSINVKK